MDFIKKHYEKIILGIVLAGLVGALVFMMFYISSDRDEMEKKTTSVINPPSKGLTNLDLTANNATLSRLASPYKLDFETGNRVFNPVDWGKTSDNSLIRAAKVGPQTCVVTNGAGIVFGNVTNVVVACGPASFSKVSTSQNNGGISSYTLAIASDGTTLDTNSPHQVGTGTGWTSIAAGLWNAHGIQSGALFQWGFGNTALPVQVGTATNWTKVICPMLGKAAIKADGTLWLWGNVTIGGPSHALPTQFGTQSWLYAATNMTHTALLRADHTLWTIGYNWYGDLGYGPVDTSSTVHPLTQVGTASDWTAVAVGIRSIAALRGASGDLYTWGWNTTGNLGDGTTVSSVSPQAAPVDTGYGSLALYANEVFGIKSNGELWGFGYNANNTLGLGAATGITTVPHQLP